MISYSRDSQEAIPSSAVKIVGLGGAGANMLERIALDGMEGAELLALNTDVRTLSSCLAREKVQLGVNLTKGLGTGGDPELGQQAMLEAESEVRAALKGQSIVFLCAGLGGGTGSGAAPIIARIAREEGAFVVVFATMPFFFEGRRRREQAETALNQLAVLSNALVTFDNNRMGELVLAKQGIHEAFAAADRMISESIKAVIRLVVRPGLINVGLDDLMSALRTTRSRCLFGSGIADGKDRAAKALRNALSSPLLDQGSLLKEAQTVLVHLSGGESLTLFEIELLMRSLQKYVPEKAHVLFGAAIDPMMGDKLSITLISALPEDALAAGVRDSLSFAEATVEATEPQKPEPQPEPEIENPFSEIDRKEITQPLQTQAPAEVSEVEPAEEETWDIQAPKPRSKVSISIGGNLTSLFGDSASQAPEEVAPSAAKTAPEPEEEERPFAEFIAVKPAAQSSSDANKAIEPEPVEAHPKLVPTEEIFPSKPFTEATAKSRPSKNPIWGKSDEPATASADGSHPTDDGDIAKDGAHPAKSARTELKLDPKHSGGQSELAFDSAPRGRFEGENPNVFEGEDLDLPPFLRKKRS
jgi:cell division protein FtsZ